MKRILSTLWQHGVIAILCATMLITACSSPATVVTDIGDFIPAITNVADAICAFTSAPICTSGVASVSASAQVLIVALQNYYAAKANGPVPQGIISELNTAITVFENDASAILDAVHVLNPTKQAEIEAIVAAVQVLLGVIETLLPTDVTTKLRFKTATTPTWTSKDFKDWVKDYNSKVSTLQLQMPRNVTLKKIHIHNVVLRKATLGIVK